MVVDEVVGFCYFDFCDLFGFVDGMVNLIGYDIGVLMLVGSED